MAAWVRSGVLAGIDELITELGGDAAALRSQVELDGSAFHDPDFPIPATAVVQFLERAAAACSCETFGLLLSQKQDFSIFGPLWPLFRSAATVEDMLRDLVEFFPLHTRGALVSIVKTPDGQMLTYDIAAGVAQSRRQVIELGIGFITRQLRRLRPDWHPSEVLLRHGAPAKLTWHRRLLGQNLQFNADRNAIFVDDRMLLTAFGSDDVNLRSHLAAKFGGARGLLTDAFKVRVEIVVRGLLPFARCDLSSAARIMRLTPRTLQRRLAAVGTSFDQTVDKVRADLAISYLRDSNLTVGALAEILQFSETSALSRAFRRWYGVSARQVRTE